MNKQLELLQQAVRQQNDQLHAQGFHGQLSMEVTGEKSNPSISLFRNTNYGFGVFKTIKTRLVPDLPLKQAARWLQTFNPQDSGFDQSNPEFLPFPNGFDSWQRTHFEIVRRLDPLTFKSPFASSEDELREELYDHAQWLTSEFECTHRGRLWTDDFPSALEEFFHSKHH